MKEDVLAIKWSKREKDLMIHYPRRCDGALIQSHICADVCEFDFQKWIEQKRTGKNDDYAAYRVFNLITELKNRGYDITTLKFSIQLKKDEPIIQETSGD